MAVRRRKDSKTYFIDTYVDTAQGRKRIRRTLKATDKRVARMKADIEQKELGGPNPYSRKTLDEFIQEFELWSKGRKESTSHAADRYTLNRLKAGILVRYLDEITPKMADDLVTKLAQEMKPVSVNFYLRALKAIFNTALRWNYVPANPFKPVKLLRFEKEIPKVLSPDEFRSFLQASKNIAPELTTLFEFYLLTGARRSEALRLEWSDIDFDRRIVTLRKTKGKRPRAVYMSNRVRTILSARRELKRPFSFFQDTVSRKFTLIAQSIGISGVSLKRLRSSFATYASDAGISDLMLEWMMGHQEKDVTRVHYIGMLEDSFRKKIDQMETLIYGPAEP